MVRAAHEGYRWSGIDMNSLPTFCSSHRRARWRKQAAHVQQEPNNLLKVGSIIRDSYVIFATWSCNICQHYKLIKLNAFKLIVQNCIDCGLPGTSLKQHPSKILIFVIDAFVSPYYNPKVACHLKWSSMDPNGKYIIFKLQTLRFRTVFSAMDQARSLWFCIICRIKGVKHYEHCTLYFSCLWIQEEAPFVSNMLLPSCCTVSKLPGSLLGEFETTKFWKQTPLLATMYRW